MQYASTPANSRVPSVTGARSSCSAASTSGLDGSSSGFAVVWWGIGCGRPPGFRLLVHLEEDWKWAVRHCTLETKETETLRQDCFGHKDSFNRSLLHRISTFTFKMYTRVRRVLVVAQNIYIYLCWDDIRNQETFSYTVWVQRRLADMISELNYIV